MSAAPAPLALDTVVFTRRLSTPAAPAPPLRDIDLDILPGEIFTVVGRAGSGKSTLLEALVGLQEASADELMVCGADPRRFPQAVKQRIGVAPRRVAVERGMTVDEALRWFAAFYERADVDRALDWLRLRDVRTRAVDTLPAGVAQRLSLALALLNDPAVLFADEPARDLEPEHAHLVWELLADRRERGRTSIITTDHVEQAARLSDRIAVLHRGRLVAAEAPSVLVARAQAPVHVTFELLKTDVPLDAVRSLDAVIDARLERSEYVLVSADGPATLRAVLRLLESSAVTPLTIGMRQQSVEDVVLALTHD